MTRIFIQNNRLWIGKTFQAPCRRVWEVVTDTLLWPEWGPSITAVQSKERFIAEGSSGRIRTILGGWLPFFITEFRDETCWRWRVGGLRATGHHVLPLDDNSCILYFDMPLWAPPYVFVCWNALNRIHRILKLDHK